MTLDQLAAQGVMDMRLPEWQPAQHARLNLSARPYGFGLGNWVEVWGFGERFALPVYQLSAPDGDRWEAGRG